MLGHGSLLDFGWLRTNEAGTQLLTCLQQRDGGRLRQYGLLEHPHIPSHMHLEEVTYKVMVVGKAGVGKTSTVARLTGSEVPLTHNETPGLQTSTVYWPGRIQHLGKNVLFNIQLFDAGDAALKRYDHILPACKDRVDAILFLFSFDLHAHSEVTQRDIRDLESNWQVPVLQIRNLHSAHQSETIAGAINDISPVLNTLCEHLWHRDVVMSGKG
ncbi:hypothetical protein BaRGS_00027337 [Batillaria attramentaria]|uniref:REM2- and Rab-like small GTPase 1 n=1 Tax=Batillaria attramentaria TaxID=370345 RepID=A0ABD0K3E5_9CAEN